MIGSCDNCNRQDVPVTVYETIYGATTQCHICTAAPWEKNPDPDPYAELEEHRDSDGTATAADCEDNPVPNRTAKRGLKASPNPSPLPPPSGEQSQ